MGKTMQLTDEGKKKFGEFLKDCGTRLELTSEQAIAQFVTTESGIRVPPSAINAFVRADWQTNPNINYLNALLISGLLKFAPHVKEGRSLEFNDIVAVFCGELDPFTGKCKGKNGAANL